MDPSDVTDWRKQWKQVEFNDMVEIVGIVRGRSAANFRANSKICHASYTIFMSDLLDMAINGDLDGNRLSGEFIVKKKGRNLGIRLKHTPARKGSDEGWRLGFTSLIPDYI